MWRGRQWHQGEQTRPLLRVSVSFFLWIHSCSSATVTLSALARLSTTNSRKWERTYEHLILIRQNRINPPVVVAVKIVLFGITSFVFSTQKHDVSIQI